MRFDGGMRCDGWEWRVIVLLVKASIDHFLARMHRPIEESAVMFSRRYPATRRWSPYIRRQAVEKLVGESE